MNREKFQVLLGETSNMVSDRIYTISQTYENIDLELHTLFNVVFNGRKNSKLLKPTLFRIVYEMYGGKDFSKISDIAVIFELINISSYQSNSAFDHKIGAYSKQDKDSQFISSFLTRELITNLVIKSSIPNRLKFNLFEEISKINESIYLAQHYDLNRLKVGKYDKYKNNPNKFNQDYYKRCQLGSGYFSGACARIAALLAGESKEVANNIFNLTETYGTLLHMINDLGDYIPNEKYSSDRVYQDNLSDFKNGRLTLPLFLLLSTTNTEPSAYDESNIIDKIQPYLIQSKKQIIVEYRKLNKALAIIPRTEKGNMYKLMLSTLKSNKYFYRIKYITPKPLTTF